jgi:hypothetical protein
MPPLGEATHRSFKVQTGTPELRGIRKDAKKVRTGTIELWICAKILFGPGGDRRFLTAWFRLFPVAPEVLDVAAELCKPGSAAAAELEELFLDAAAFDNSSDDPDDFDANSGTLEQTPPGN